METAQWLLVVGVVAFTLLGAVCDARLKKLPNVLVVPGFALGLVYHLVTGAFEGGASGAVHGLAFALGGFGTGFGILFVLWLIGGGGGGDVKMMGALGAWLGAKLTLYVFFTSAVFVAFAGVAVVVIQICLRGIGYVRGRYMSHAKTEAQKRFARTPEARTKRRLLPYGVPLALAAWTVLAYDVWRHSLGAM